MRLDSQEHLKDEEILALSLNKPSFFELLVERYQESFLRTAFNILNNKEDSEDTVQDTFVKIYLNGGKFKKQEGASFKSWAYKILINTALTRYKKSKQMKMLTVSVSSNDFYNVISNNSEEDFVFNLDARVLISKALEEMPSHLQSVLRKYYLEDKSQKDIAKEEGVSSMAVKMRIFRAKKNFKKILGENKIYA